MVLTRRQGHSMVHDVSMTMRKLLMLPALILAGSLLSACSGTSSSDKAHVKQLVLNLSDLPPLGNSSPAPKVGSISQSCQRDAFKSVPAISRGVVSFTNGNDLPVITQYLGSYRSGKHAFSAIYKQARSCHSALVMFGLYQATMNMEPIRFPSVGDQSEAFAQQLYFAGNSATQNLVIVRKGDFVTIVEEEDLGSDFTSFKRIVSVAVSKIPGD